MVAQTANVVPILTSLKRAMAVEAEEAPLEQSPKRAKISIPDYTAVNFSQIKLEDCGTNAQGARLVKPLLGSAPLHCNLTPLGFQVTPFGFDVSGKYQKPSFLSGGPAKKSEGLNLRVRIRAHDELNFLIQLNSKFQQKFEELDKDSKWQPLVVVGPPDPLDLTKSLIGDIKVKVVLAGQGLTQLKIIDRECKIHEGEGWDFLQPFLSDFKNFCRARLKVAICVSSLWNVDKKAGLTLTATQLVLTFPKPLPKASKVDETLRFENTFDNDALLMELAESNEMEE